MRERRMPITRKPMMKLEKPGGNSISPTFGTARPRCSWSQRPKANWLARIGISVRGLVTKQAATVKGMFTFARVAMATAASV